jgi:hypothetical protein
VSCIRLPGDSLRTHFPAEQSCGTKRLFWLVPSSCTSSQVHIATTKKRALEEADQKAEGVQLTDAVHACLSKGEDAPADFHDSKPKTWSHALDDKGAGYLHDRIRDGVDTASVCVLVAVHVQFFLHARDVGVGHVSLVQMFHEKAEAANAED